MLRSWFIFSCGKSLKSADDIQMHSARTGHAKYLESTEEIKPLTEEEKRAQIMKLRVSDYSETWFCHCLGAYASQKIAAWGIG